MINFYNSAWLAFDRIHIFVVIKTRWVCVVGKYTMTIVISFWQVGTLNAKNEIESLPKSMKGDQDQAIYISHFSTGSKQFCSQCHNITSFFFHLNKEESCAQDLMMIIMIMIMIIRLTDNNDHENGLCTEPVYILLDSSWPNICIPWK